MGTNVALWDRIIRLIIGTFTVAWAIAGGPYWAYAGLILVITGAWGVCPIYGFLKINT